MAATLCENLQVEIVSQTLGFSGDTVAIMAVRQFPPEGMEQRKVFKNDNQTSSGCNKATPT